MYSITVYLLNAYLIMLEQTQARNRELALSLARLVLHRVSCASRMRDAAGTLRQHGNKTVIDLLKVSWESVVIGKLILLWEKEDLFSHFSMLDFPSRGDRIRVESSRLSDCIVCLWVSKSGVRSYIHHGDRCTVCVLRFTWLCTGQISDNKLVRWT